MVWVRAGQASTRAELDQPADLALATLWHSDGHHFERSRAGDRGTQINTNRHDLVVPVTATDHSLGSEHARVTVVEYGDFECPSCKNAAPAVKMLLADY